MEMKHCPIARKLILALRQSSVIATGLIVSLTHLALTACTGIEPDDAVRQELVIEGWIADGEFPVVFVTTTLPVQQQVTPLDSLERFIAQWARVQVTTEDDTVLLTGIVDHRYFPPYYFTSNHLRGRAEQRYNLTVDWHGLHAEATTTVLPPVLIDSVWTQTTATSDTLRDLCVRFHDNPQTNDYYLLLSRRQAEPLNPQLCVFGTVNDRVLRQPDVTLYARRGGVLAESDYSSYYSLGDSVRVTLAHVDSVAFQFWRAYEDNRQLSTSSISTVFNPLTTNVRGGRGLWQGCGFSHRWIIVE